METRLSSAQSAVCRVGVFIDWQNCYRTARDAFGFAGGGGIPGNIKPLALASRLTGQRLAEQGPGELTKLRIYTGRASQRHDRRTYAANRRQFQAWTNADPDKVDVVARTLDYTLGHPREKGIDVQLAIDAVRAALFDHEHDVTIIVSADTDLLPVLELLVTEGGAHCVEVASWQGPHWSPQPLTLAGVRIRQHALNRALYDRLADATDYNIAQAARPQPQLPGQSGRRLPPHRR